jgi:hypothetical protein
MDAAIAAAHRRVVEQLMSDEHVLGALPEDAAGRLLDWAVQRVDAAASIAPNLDAFYVASDAVLAEARATVDAVAAEGGDGASVDRRLAALAGPWPDTEPAHAHAARADDAARAGASAAQPSVPVVAAAESPPSGMTTEPTACRSAGESYGDGGLREALEDAVDRVRALFRRRSDDG